METNNNLILLLIGETMLEVFLDGCFVSVVISLAALPISLILFG
tara:strand:- start:1067 stop:1198 length:132 start_codon:yes stop_codon:yes gene_type:complete